MKISSLKGQTILLDTSALIKSISDEDHSDIVRVIMNMCESKEIMLILADFMLYELLNVLIIGKRYKTQDAARFLDYIQTIKEQSMVVDEAIIARCMNIMQEHRLASYDALFIASAEMKKMKLITADYRHHQKKVSPNIIHLKDLR